MRRRARDLRADNRGAARDLADMVRRVAVTSTARALWTWLGYSTEVEVETDDAPVFGGIGIYARPAAGQGEAILLHVGGSPDHPALVALRDEAARLRYVAEFGDVAAGETAIHGSAGTARVLVTADGDVEITPAAGRKVYIRTKDGATDQLVTKADFMNHAHATAGTGSPVAPTPLSGEFAYTSVLESE